MNYDIIIIGSGPAGYVSAIRAGQLGMKVAIIEKEKIGGMCLNWGCIPSKAMIESAKLYRKIQKDAVKFGITGIDKKQLSFNYAKAVQRANSIVTRLTKGVEFLLKKNSVEIEIGEGKIIDAQTVSLNNRTLKTRNIILATGTRFVPVSQDAATEISVKDFFAMKEIPDKIAVYGYDAPSLEIAQMLAMIDKEVTLLVKDDNFMPLADNFLVDYAKKIFKNEKIRVITDLKDTKIQLGEKRITIGDKTVEYDLILNVSNREAVLPPMEISMEMGDGFVKTDENLETSVPGIYAIGDVNGKSRFAHVASAEGLFVVNALNGIKGKMEFEKYPLNMYTHPEMAQIGKTTQQLTDEGVDFKISEFSLAANGKALAEGNNDGMVRILSEKKYGEVLGVQIVAEHATDMISEAAAFLQLESTVYDVAHTVHAHPTVSEAFIEAGFEGVDQAIHK